MSSLFSLMCCVSCVRIVNPVKCQDSSVTKCRVSNFCCVCCVSCVVFSVQMYRSSCPTCRHLRATRLKRHRTVPARTVPTCIKTSVATRVIARTGRSLRMHRIPRPVQLVARAHREKATTPASRVSILVRRQRHCRRRRRHCASRSRRWCLRSRRRCSNSTR